jgi:hypothetical protein
MHLRVVEVAQRARITRQSWGCYLYLVELAVSLNTGGVGVLAVSSFRMERNATSHCTFAASYVYSTLTLCSCYFDCHHVFCASLLFNILCVPSGAAQACAARVSFQYYLNTRYAGVRLTSHELVQRERVCVWPEITIGLTYNSRCKLSLPSHR